MVARKRVMVVVDRSSGARHATLWALNHVAGAGDIVTLLHVLHSPRKTNSSVSHSLISLCNSCRPEVEVEALSVHGPKLLTVLNQVNKLQASVLVLSQAKAVSFFSCFLPTDGEDFVERCINDADCLAMAVRKRGGVGGWLVSTRWQKNFWLLA